MDPKEKQIRDFGLQSGKSPAQIESAVAKYKGTSQTPLQSMGTDIGNAFNDSASYVAQGQRDAANAKNPFESLEAGLKQGAGIVGAAFSPLAPLTKNLSNKIQNDANTYSESPALQKFATSPAGIATARGAEDLQNTATLLSLRGAPEVPKGVGAVGDVASAGIKDATSKVVPAGSYVKSAVNDLRPRSDNWIGHNVATSLEFTPGDLAKIESSTGNSVGRWMADNNLIGVNAEETKGLISDFTDHNYQAVRDQVAMVDKIYKPSQVGRYTDALKAIEKQIGEVPGMENEWAQVKNLLAQDEITLSDVQHVKELLDEHFQLYKVTGDVKDAVSKKGIANIRSELRSFIEDEVKSNTGEDIHSMNNNVATGKSMLDTIETRAPKGLTRSNLFRKGDTQTFALGAMLGGGFTPMGALTGVAALLAKKVAESPTVSLRMARFIDQLSDAKKARIKSQLEAGKIPEELDEFIEYAPSGSQSQSGTPVPEAPTL